MSTEQFIQSLRLMEAHHTAAAKLATGLRKELEKGLTGPVSGSSKGLNISGEQLDAMAATLRASRSKTKH